MYSCQTNISYIIHESSLSDSVRPQPSYQINVNRSSPIGRQVANDPDISHDIWHLTYIPATPLDIWPKYRSRHLYRCHDIRHIDIDPYKARHLPFTYINVTPFNMWHIYTCIPIVIWHIYRSQRLPYWTWPSHQETGHTILTIDHWPEGVTSSRK